MDKRSDKVKNFGVGRFHFEDKWFLDKSFVPDFLCERTALSHVGDLPTRMAHCEDCLKKWAGKKFNGLGKKIAVLRKERMQMMRQMSEKGTEADFVEISKQIEHAVEAEASHWKQRARVNWLVNGDRNTGAFHSQASRRRKKDTIKKLKDRQEERKEEEQEKAGIIKEYFEELFASSRPTDAGGHFGGDQLSGGEDQ
ncbi:uncharacterized protein LOC130994187 [Salvia miltiorrhiza]|uniref:uncharacterized protein LOC130994187 n=1 Tax=Salvia miltiorrhiza TaxID=226208 RepID=UPI0025AD8255|nr:uncharacterized protein LOC130994187 [Salvia miltiorrhiza]